jgi:hypothetical protein
MQGHSDKKLTGQSLNSKICLKRLSSAYFAGRGKKMLWAGKFGSAESFDLVDCVVERLAISCWRDGLCNAIVISGVSVRQASLVCIGRDST